MSLSSPVIIVVGDEPLNCMNVVGQLAADGFVTLEACTGQEAFDIIAHDEPEGCQLRPKPYEVEIVQAAIEAMLA